LHAFGVAFAGAFAGSGAGADVCGALPQPINNDTRIKTDTLGNTLFMVSESSLFF
jgi:hypothetical protein